MKSVSGCGDIPYGMGFCFQSFHPFLNTWEDNPWQCIPFIRVEAKIMNLSRRNDDKYSATHTVFSPYNIMEVPHRITRRARPCSRNTVRMGPTNHVLSGSPSDHYPKLRRQNRSISRKTPHQRRLLFIGLHHVMSTQAILPNVLQSTIPGTYGSENVISIGCAMHDINNNNL